MKLGRIIQIALIAAAVLMLAGIASASTINYDTALAFPMNPYTTAFNGGMSTVLSSTGGTAAVGAATITFTGDNVTAIGVPSFINYGDFVVACATCSTAAAGTADATFGAFTADLYLWDETDNAYGEFIGTSTGGMVYADQSTINITWTTPVSLQVGAGTNNALAGGSGSFGYTYFTINPTTNLVAPDSGGGGGAGTGDTTIGGAVGSTALPEPTTMALVGGLFIGLAALARKRRA
ncbi:MAG: PEP-CTERM sorting domain-containing protein [Bryobacteraceae bacterium]